MLLRTILYGGVIMVALLVVPWVYSGEEPSPLGPGIVTDLVFSIAATFLFVSLTSIAQLIGPNILASFLTGRYYYPLEEQRIVLFLDLVGSTAIAEDIGNVRFHALLSETFTRLSRVVTDFGGEVHRYVGDALIATWPLGTPEDNARPIRCLFACWDALDAARSEVLRRHGRVPGFRASIHSGPLVAGEIGGFKREIALLGDAMNTAARLEQVARTTGHALLASKPLLDHASRHRRDQHREPSAARQVGAPGAVRPRARYAGTGGPDDRAAKALTECDAATVERLGRTRRSADLRASCTTSPTSPTLVTRGSVALVTDGA